MGITPCTDHSAADWIVDADLPWQQLVTFGPPDFPAYARLRFVADPQSVSHDRTPAVATGEDDADGLSEAGQLRLVMKALQNHTRTPDNFYFCFWDGSWGHSFTGPKVEVPERSYYLYRGNVSEEGKWLTYVSDGGASHPLEPSPAFIWPEDRAWCIANDVDPPWAGIGGSNEAIQQLMADPRLDVVRADPTKNQLSY